MECFSHFGYDGTSISQIAKQAGVAKGLIYTHFPSKEAMLLQLIESGFKQLEAGFESLMPMETKAHFEKFVRMNIAMLEEEPAFWKLYFGTLFQPSVLEIMKAHFGDFLTPYIMMFSHYYTCQGYDMPETRARSLIAYLDGMGMHILFLPEGIDKESIIQLTIEKFS